MAFDEKGKFHRLHNWTEDRLSGVNKKIQAARMDEETDIQLTLKNGDVHTIYPQNVNAVAYFKLTPEVTE